MNIIKDQRLFYKIAEDIQNKIQKKEYPIGMRLPAESNLAKQYDVSRAVIREAILSLEIQGYVQARVGAGVYVTYDLSHDTKNHLNTDAGPFEIMQARQLIESEVAALAAIRITPKDLKNIKEILDSDANIADTERNQSAHFEMDKAFHLALAEASNNNTLYLIVKNLWDLRRQNALWEKLNEHLAFTHSDWDEAKKNHEEIYKALAQKSPQKAKEAMSNHLQNIRNLLLELTQFDEILDDSPFFSDEIPSDWSK